MITDIRQEGEFGIKLTYRGNPTILKRKLLEDTPTYAIKTVTCNRNETPVVDEVLSLMMGTIPINQEIVEELIGTREALICKLHVVNNNKYEGSRNIINEAHPYTGIRIITDHIKVLDVDGNETSICPCRYSDSLITILSNEFTINVSCSIEKGYGREHVKYSPVVLVGYKQTDKVGIYDVLVESKGLYNLDRLMSIIQSYSTGVSTSLQEGTTSKGRRSKRERIIL